MSAAPAGILPGTQTAAVVATVPGAPSAGPVAAPSADHRAASLVDRAKDIASFAAPVTVVTALLVYFGYIGTRARFEYFGVYLDMTGLSNRSLVLYGLEVVYVPTAFAFLALLVLVGLHAGVHWLLTSRARTGAGLAVAALAGLAGALLVGRAVIGILVLEVARREVPGTTALALAGGPSLIAYAVWVAAHVARHRAGRFADWYGGDLVRRLRRAGLAAVAGLAVAGLFWAANSFAWAYGASRGYEDAKHLAERPEVILDTAEPLGEVPAGVTETALDTSDGSTFRYRYRGLRLLVAADGRLFLVPERWTSAGRTLVVPYDAGIRVQVAPTR